MRNRRKKSNWLGGLFFLFLFGVICLWVYVWQNKDNWNKEKQDFRFSTMSDDGWHLFSVSEARRMINVIEVDDQTKLWVPGGYSWYDCDKVVKLLKEEKREDLLDEVLFYNFAFISEKNVKLKDWRSWKSFYFWVKNFGIFRAVHFLSIKDDLLFKLENVDVDNFNSELMSKWLSRDLADNSLLEGEVEVKVFNNSGERGLANFVAKRLSWAGYLVNEVGSGKEKFESKLAYGGNKEKLANFKAWLNLKKFFGNCQTVYMEDLGEKQFSLELGKDWAKLIKYSSYEVE
ncbi:hypothetical protein DRH14_03770 [Candidatus Shapirobacteria bacterium]|nr:MAG: hypothetical protein DRH14_03770 [Candidatus Shapirobacteria bacterium]